MYHTPSKNALFDTMTDPSASTSATASSLPATQPTTPGGSSEQQQHIEHDDARRISRISVRPPPFWRENPALWFKQLESQFITNGITTSDTKFHIAVSALDTAIISQVSDVVMNPPRVGKYERLKQSLQERFADSEEQRFRKLLGNVHLGDKKPSYLWREMRELANNNINDQVLRSLWMQRLPTQSQAILSAEDGNIDRLLTLADRIHDIFGAPEVNAFNSHPQQFLSHTNAITSPQIAQQPSAISMLCEQVSQLTHQVAALTSKNNNQNNSRSRSISRSDHRRRPRSKTPHANCWYHHRYGVAAKKCISPCEFEKNKSEN